TIVVDVPLNTPTGDDIYLSTDRSNYSPAEIRMNRIDARRWTIALKVPAGTELHYQFTRGSLASVERDRNGSLLTPRLLETRASVTVDDHVARWADLN
ncbi:MAG: hypothetical protein ACREM8_14050, partial [Vulcanimicrobiaceae bacterium]